VRENRTPGSVPGVPGNRWLYGDDVDPVVFAPPLGMKTGTESLRDAVQWRMVWINSYNFVPETIVVYDPIPEGMEYVPDSLQCTAKGTL
jgi:uncharacterized repeat protein (TIGR01451 family)